ncbi:hypothetical protein [Gluconobacter oxydans]|uniref:Uncharacterized protein n=1 Tax=Gluconobacter oxydans TaxID=442 RepID=A0A149RXQ6_GLUOY|nr:hypothetical protein [Gluconobacter oxydans]KXV19235.1 hypothetical protein AD934_05305 [Gluconobacter oxydans]
MTLSVAEEQKQFRTKIAGLRQACEYWTETPRKPEAHLMMLMVDSMEAMGERCLAAQSACEQMAEDCRRASAEEMAEVHAALRKAGAMSLQMQQIDEKTVKAKVAEILGTVKKEVALSMNLQIKQAGVYVRRDRIMQQAAWFATMIVGGTVFGIIIDHLI